MNVPKMKGKAGMSMSGDAKLINQFGTIGVTRKKII
jgi:hypothetical protein